MKKGMLYIVATPIGNLEDITLRALRILKEVDVIAAEDTRHSARLLHHYGISKKLISYWGEREKLKADEILKRLHSGQSVALITDAGTPGISDPGSVLIKKAIEEAIDIVPVPGPSAVITALSVSGISCDEFIFCGFLPSKASQRRKALYDLSLEKRTIVLYEAPHRIIETLSDIQEIFGRRKIAVIKELTKIHEEIFRGDVQDVISMMYASKIAGEYVIVVEGKWGKTTGIDEAMKEISMLMKKGLARKEAVKKVAGEYGLSSKELYDRSIAIEHKRN